MPTLFPPSDKDAKPIFHVLVVDDSSSNRRIMMRHIAKHLTDNNISFEIDEAENGQLAVNKVELMLEEKLRNYHFIILDNEMPVMKGEEAAVHMDNLETKHQLPPDKTAYVATWSTSRDKPFDGSQAQLAKPVNKKELEEMINHVLILNHFEPSNTPPPHIRRRSSGQ